MIASMTEPTTPAPDQFSIDESSEFGARAAKHLREDPVVWLTTVSPTGSPTPNPVWFLWDGAGSVWLYSMPTAARIQHLASSPRVSLNFTNDTDGDDVVVLTAVASVDRGLPRADAVPEYVAKYDRLIEQLKMTPQSFAESYSVPIEVRLRRLRGF